LDLNKKSNKQQVLISCFHHWTELQGVELDGEPAAVCSQHRQHEGLPLLLVHTHSFPVRSELGQAPSSIVAAVAVVEHMSPWLAGALVPSAHYADA